MRRNQLIIEQIRINLRMANKEIIEETKRTSKILFELNNTLPFSDKYNMLLKELFTGGFGENCYIAAPLYINIVSNIHIGNHISINYYFRCMSVGEISIGCEELAAVRIIPKLFMAFKEKYSNVHLDLYTGNADQTKQRIDILLEPVEQKRLYYC